MKKTLLKITYLLFALFIQQTFSQETIIIPDVALEECLIALNIDTNGLNGSILKSDAEYVEHLKIFDPPNNKNLSKKVYSKIKDLTGVEHFPNLTRLTCYGNEISKIDLSKNKKLTFLSCSDNKINYLDLSKNNKLKTISCDMNQITVLKLGNKPQLTELFCNGNSLSKLKLKNCPKLEMIDISDNKNLKEVLVSPSKINNISEDSWYKDSTTKFVTKFQK